VYHTDRCGNDLNYNNIQKESQLLPSNVVKYMIINAIGPKKLYFFKHI
jgi:hypothetical protein